MQEVTEITAKLGFPHAHFLRGVFSLPDDVNLTAAAYRYAFRHVLQKVEE